jgi:hypothetical protein
MTADQHLDRIRSARERVALAEAALEAGARDQLTRRQVYQAAAAALLAVLDQATGRAPLPLPFHDEALRLVADDDGRRP